ncbi:TIGR04282 family arsenosugar biosynthesis glycosyltransferase [Deinococcus yavapaiensis]|uniref:TIGR04282 family arsenosugar biosynthesis glycosyltransferase n=1 Tax=Deinococcus yavapaiensis TaxID=309889 RepID=UPI001474F512|nr:TIGR04282 family arsenosugar biosynthesis glycosyltransferase [Deinococcus yavapaiensis]
MPAHDSELGPDHENFADRRTLVVVAKRPRAGEVKTRIAATLGPDVAARVYESALLDTLDLVRSCAASPLLSFAPPTPEARSFFTALAPDFALAPQLGEDFGARLVSAFRAAFDTGARAVVLIGTDNPSLPRAHVQSAFDALARPDVDVVLGAVTDGGYYLLGMKHLHDVLFQRIAWSTEVVADQTRERAREGGLHLVDVASWYDLDVEDDLRTLLSDVRTVEDGRAPRTRALLESLKSEAAK